MPILFLGHRNPLENQNQCAPRRTYVDRFIGGIQNEDRGEQGVPVSSAMWSDRRREMSSGMPGS
jgi:hypothetical protein